MMMATTDSHPFPRLPRYTIFFGVGILGFALDQVSKLLVLHHPLLREYAHPDWGSGITVIPQFFYLVHVGNTGAAWGMFSNHGFILGILAASALLAIWFFRRALILQDPVNQLALGLAAGGILGNLIDRISRGEVLDFLLFRFGKWDYPVFNVADSGIFLGVMIYLFHNWHRSSEKGDSPS